jgi:predicted RNase H-like HicB family nuclease
MICQAIFERAVDGTIWGYIPELPGASGSGDSLKEARESLAVSTRLWIEDARSRGDATPEPSTIGAYQIEVA